MYLWCIWLSASFWIGDRRQFFIIYKNCFSSIFCFGIAFSNNHCYSITCMKYLVGTQKRVLRFLHGIAVDEVDLPSTRDTIQCFNIFSSINFYYTRHAFSFRNIHTFNISMCIWTSNKSGIGHVRQFYIIGIFALTR